MKAFLSRPEDTPVIDQLRGEWLKLLGKRQQWDQFDAEYPRLLNEDTDLTCYALQSRRRTQEQAALREARNLWFTGKGLPDSCGPLFDAALSAGIITEQRYRPAAAPGSGSEQRVICRPAGRKNSETNTRVLPALLKNAAADPDRYLKKLTPNDSNSMAIRKWRLQQTASVSDRAQASGIQTMSNAALQGDPGMPASHSSGAVAPSPSSGWPGGEIFCHGWASARRAIRYPPQHMTD